MPRTGSRQERDCASNQHRPLRRQYCLWSCENCLQSDILHGRARMGRLYRHFDFAGWHTQCNCDRSRHPTKWPWTRRVDSTFRSHNDLRTLAVRSRDSIFPSDDAAEAYTSVLLSADFSEDNHSKHAQGYHRFHYVIRCHIRHRCYISVSANQPLLGQLG